MSQTRVILPKCGTKASCPSEFCSLISAYMDPFIVDRRLVGSMWTSGIPTDTALMTGCWNCITESHQGSIESLAVSLYPFMVFKCLIYRTGLSTEPMGCRHNDEFYILWCDMESFFAYHMMYVSHLVILHHKEKATVHSAFL